MLGAESRRAARSDGQIDRRVRGTSVCAMSAHSRACAARARAQALLRRRALDVLYPRCCGLDGHKKSVVACVLTPGRAGQPGQETRTLGTMTAELVAVIAWLEASGRAAAGGVGLRRDPRSTGARRRRPPYFHSGVRRLKALRDGNQPETVQGPSAAMVLEDQALPASWA
jgi:hypothetical protein